MRPSDDLLTIMEILADDVGELLTMQDRLALARKLRHRAFIEEDDIAEVLGVIASGLECFGLSMDTDGQEHS